MVLKLFVELSPHHLPLRVQGFSIHWSVVLKGLYRCFEIFHIYDWLRELFLCLHEGSDHPYMCFLHLWLFSMRIFPCIWGNILPKPLFTPFSQHIFGWGIHWNVRLWVCSRKAPANIFWLKFITLMMTSLKWTRYFCKDSEFRLRTFNRLIVDILQCLFDENWWINFLERSW